MATTVSRNFRIKNHIWNKAYNQAQNMGVSMTFIVEHLLEDFSRNSDLIVEDIEYMSDVPEDIQNDVDKIFDALANNRK